MSSLYPESGSFLTIDVDDFDGIAGKYNVAMMPTFLVVQGNQVLGTYRGSSEPELETFLRSQLAS
jgi:Thioredoxin